MMVFAKAESFESIGEQQWAFDNNGLENCFEHGVLVPLDRRYWSIDSNGVVTSKFKGAPGAFQLQDWVKGN